MPEAWSSVGVVEKSTLLGVYVRPILGPSWHEALEEYIQASLADKIWRDGNGELTLTVYAGEGDQQEPVQEQVDPTA
eukprot:2642951-Amphidinium_carterae.1